MDVYSYAIVVWELLAGKRIYHDSRWTGKFAELKKKVCFEGLRPEIPSDWPLVLVDLLKRCWNDEPTLRPSFDVILKVSCSS